MLSRLRPMLVVALLSVMGILAGCEEPAPPPVQGPRPIKFFEVGSDASAQSREYPGRIKAGQYSEMGFEVAGRVTEFVYTEGAPVEKGAVLARIDPRDYQSRFDSAKARLEQARSERDRYKQMYEKDVKPYSEYEVRIRAFEVAEADLQQAQKALDDTVLRAPFDGVMARKLVEEFENVVAKQPVLVMQNDDLLEIKVSVPERDLAEGRGRNPDLAELTERLSPRVVLSSLPDRSFPAALKEIAAVADPTTRTFEATFQFTKPEGVNILGGMTAKVIISLAGLHDAEGLWIPAQAVLADANGAASVYVVDPETMTVSSRSVSLGDMQGDHVSVLDGLQRGEIIANSGVHQLHDGMSVARFQR